jgi:hypothetical protein
MNKNLETSLFFLKKRAASVQLNHSEFVLISLAQQV